MKVNLDQAFAAFSDHWSPRIAADLNGQQVKLAKFKGEFVWHSHENEDELFIVFKGTLIMDFRDHTLEVKPGEILIVPKGIEHRPRTNGEEVWTLLVEPKSTLHTGNDTHKVTVAVEAQARI